MKLISQSASRARQQAFDSIDRKSKPRSYIGQTEILVVEQRQGGALAIRQRTHGDIEPSWQAVVPYVTIVAELEEGPRLVATAKELMDSIK